AAESDAAAERRAAGGGIRSRLSRMRGGPASVGARAPLSTTNVMTINPVGGTAAPVPLDEDEHDPVMADTVLDPSRATLRPKLIWFNLALTVAVMVLLVI